MPRANHRASLPFIFVTVLLDMMGVGLVMPVLPTLVGELTTSVELQAYWYGALTFTFGLTQFACAPSLGALSDRYGRRVVLLMSIAGLGTMFVLSGLARTLPQLLAARLIGGAMASNVSVANAYAADITTPETRARSFGILGAAFGLGFILGPMLGGLVGGISIRLPFFLAGGLAILNFLNGLFVLPESLPAERRRPFDARKANPFVALSGLTRLKGVGMLVAVIALAALAQYILIFTWVLFNTHRFGWGPPQNGASFFVVGVTSAVVQGGLLGVFLRHLGERRLVLAGLASSTLAYVAYGLATQGWMMFVIVMANMLAFGVGAAVNAMVSKAAPPEQQGLAMGSIASVNSAMAVVGPVVGLPLFARVSRYPKDDLRVGACFFVCAALSAIALALAMLHFARTPAPGELAASDPS